MTSDLAGRAWREHASKGLTATHGITHLVWHELHGAMESAILRQKRVKKRRAWKIERIESVNPYWNHPSVGIVEGKDTGFPLSRE